MRNQIQIKEGKLTEMEITSLTEEIANTPHIVYVRPDFWQKIKVFAMRKDSELIGVCGAVILKNGWTKIGPMIIKSAFRKKGFGNYLIHEVIKNLENTRIFIQTSNVHLIKLLNNQNNFRKIKIIDVPYEVKIFLFTYIFHNFDLQFIKAYFSKRFLKFHHYHYFIKLTHE